MTLTSPRSSLDNAQKAQEASSVSGRRSLRDITCFTALLVIAYTLLLYTHYHPLACIAAIIMVSKAQYSLMVSGHEAIHYLLFKNRSLNDWVGRYICAGPMGVGFYRARATHTNHHRYPLGERDEELYHHLENPDRKTFLLHLLRPLLGGYFLKGVLRLAGRTPQGRVKPHYSISVAKRRSDLVAIIISSLVLATLLVIIDWKLYVFFWIAPLVTVTAFSHNLKTFLDHAHLTGDPEDTLYLYNVSWIDRIFFPVHQALHAGHHIYPYVPYHQLPKLEPILKALPNVRSRQGYWGFIIEYIRTEFSNRPAMTP